MGRRSRDVGFFCLGAVTILQISVFRDAFHTATHAVVSSRQAISNVYSNYRNLSAHNDEKRIIASRTMYHVPSSLAVLSVDCLSAEVQSELQETARAKNRSREGFDPMPEFVFTCLKSEFAGADHRNRREAGNYLEWIVRNYEKLPPDIIFLHGHTKAWHQDHIVPVLLNARKIVVGLRNSTTCSADGYYFSVSKSQERSSSEYCYNRWQTNDRDFYQNTILELFREWALLPELPVPDLFDNCLYFEHGAQFAVSSSRILSRSIKFWNRLYNYTRVCTPSNDGFYRPSSAQGSQSKGCFHNLMEYIWHYVLGEKAKNNSTFLDLPLPYRGDCSHQLQAVLRNMPK